MSYEPDRHHRRSIRLQAYDYSQSGAYFVTVVCRERALLLEDPTARAIVDEAWRWLATRYEYVQLDEYVVMPNHLHGILVLSDVRRGGSRTAPTPQRTKRKPPGRLVAVFKTVSTKRINAIRGTSGLPFWQRNYYERIIRDENELNRVRQYIVENPMCWDLDPENPSARANEVRRTRDFSDLIRFGEAPSSPNRAVGRVKPQISAKRRP
jgi:REP element-mobilizing transposase RayT